MSLFKKALTAFQALALAAFVALVAQPLPSFAQSTAVTAGTATATSGAATLANNYGVITSESLSTAAGATYTLTVTDTNIVATDLCMASDQYGTSTTGSPAVMTVTPGAGTLVIKVQNIHASAALNGTIVISFACLKA